MSKKDNSSSDEESEKSEYSIKIIDDEEEDDTDEDIAQLPINRKVSTTETSEEEDEEEESSKKDGNESDVTMSIDKVVPIKVELDNSGSDEEVSGTAGTWKGPRLISSISDENEEDDATIIPDDVMSLHEFEASSSDSSESLSQNSIAEMLEAQIKIWYKETGMKRPKKRNRTNFESILQEDLDFSDLMLTNEEIEIMKEEIDGMKKLTLDDLLFKITSDL